MGFGRLLPEESRAVTYQSVWGSGGDWNNGRTWAGNTVDYSTALTLSTVYACVRLLTDDISTLPAGAFVKSGAASSPLDPEPYWIDEPDAGLLWGDYVQQTVLSMLLTHGACTRIYRGGLGDPVALVPLDPLLTEPVRNPRTRDAEFIWNQDYANPISRRDMIYLPMLRRPGSLKGVSPLDELKQSLGLTSALDEFAARFFSNGSTTTGIIEVPAVLTATQAKEALDVFEESHKGTRRSHRPAVLGGGGKFNKTGVDPEQAQMLQSRQHAVEEIARIFRVPLHMLQVAAPGVQSYSSNEQNEIQYVKHTVRPIVSKLEKHHSRLLPGKAFLRINLEGLLRGDLTTRYTAYAQAALTGFMNLDEIRALEDMPPIVGGSEYRVPLANINLGAADLVSMDKKIIMAQRLVVIGFDPAEALAALGLPPITHTGLPSVLLQGVAQIDPDDPASVYPTVGERELVKRIERDADGNITAIYEGRE